MKNIWFTFLLFFEPNGDWESFVIGSDGQIRGANQFQFQRSFIERRCPDPSRKSSLWRWSRHQRSIQYLDVSVPLRVRKETCLGTRMKISFPGECWIMEIIQENLNFFCLIVNYRELLFCIFLYLFISRIIT